MKDTRQKTSLIKGIETAQTSSASLVKGRGTACGGGIAKQILSLILTLCMLTSSVVCTSFTAFADTANDRYFDYRLAFGVTQSGQLTDDTMNGTLYACYQFSLDEYTSMIFDYDAISTLKHNGVCKSQLIYIIRQSDYSNYKIGKSVNFYYINSTSTTDSNNYWLDDTISLYEGTYLLMITTLVPNTGNGSSPKGNINYSFSLTPTVTKLRNLKAKQTNTTCKLSWTGDLGASCYEIEQKTDNTYKMLKTTSETSLELKKLTSATPYIFRVRGCKIVDNVKYFGEWSYATICTLPDKASIKTPSTKAKHQIKAKWSTVKRASGYQVEYCSNKKCTKLVSSATVAGQAKTSYTEKGFKKGKTYYVRVRAYKTYNGKTYYGAWSSVKKIKSK